MEKMSHFGLFCLITQQKEIRLETQTLKHRIRKKELIISIKESMIVNLADIQNVSNTYAKFKISFSNALETQALKVKIDLKLNSMPT